MARNTHCSCVSKMYSMCYLLGNQADAVIRWKLLEYFLVYKLCNLLYSLIGLQRNTLYSKSNQRVTRFLQHYRLPFISNIEYSLGQYKADSKVSRPESSERKKNYFE